MKILNLVMLLILLITPTMFGEQQETLDHPMINVPPHLQRFMEVDGRTVIYFDEMGFVELSKILWDDRVATAERAAMVAAIPLKEEVAKLKKQRKTFMISTAVAGVLAIAGAVIVVVK